MLRFASCSHLRCLFAATLLPLILLQPLPVAAQDEALLPALRIAAVVNDTAITDQALDERIRLALVMAGIPDSEETRRRAGPQILRQFIDETLKWQAVQAANIRVSEEELQRALASLKFPGRKSKPGSPVGIEELERFLRQHRVSLETLKRQVRSDMGWTKLVLKKIQPKVIVTQADIDSAIEQIRNRARLDPEFSKKFPPLLRLYHIIYPLVEDAPREQVVEVIQWAMDLREEVQKDCPAFLEKGRDINRLSPVDRGTVALEELHPVLRDKVAPLQEGDITEPFRTAEGVHLIMVCGRQQVLPPIDPNEIREVVFREKLDLEVMEYMRDLRKNAYVEIR